MQSPAAPKSSATDAPGDLALKALRVSESRYRRLFETAQDGIMLLNADTAQIEDVNPYLIELLGYSHAEFLGKKLWEVGSFADIAQSKEMFEVLQTQGYVKYKDLPLKTKMGEKIAVEFVSNSYDCEGVKVIQCNIRNISERKADQAKILRHTQLYSALSQCNKAIVHCTSEEELFLETCRAAVLYGGMKMAWIGLIDSKTRMVRPVASFGDDTEYLKDIDISVDADSPFGHGPTGTAIREDQPHWCQDFMHDPANAPWHELARRAGFAASASLPLHRKGIVIGTFTLYSGEVDAFDASARNLLLEMASDVSFALDNFARESRRKQVDEEAHRLTQRLTTTLESITDAFFTVDQEWRFTFLNREAERLLGRTREELTGQEFWKEFPGTIGSPFEREYRRAIADNKAVDFEAFYPPLNIFFGVRAYPSEQGLAVYFLDITEVKRAEEEMKLKNTILQTQMDTSLDAILVVGENEQIISCNQQFIDLWHLPTELVNAGLNAPVLKSVAAQVRNPETFVARVQYLNGHHDDKSREEVPLKDSRIIDRYSAPITAADGKYYGRVWYFRDITERKRAEQELRISATAFEAQEGIIVTDADKVILRVNQAFTLLTGYSAEEAIGQTPALVKSGRQSPEFYRRMWKALAIDHFWQGEIWNRRKNGEVHPDWLIISAVTNAEGEITNYVSAYSDLTQYKKHEAAIHSLAYYDPLTSLPNRRLLIDRLQHTFAASARHHNHSAVLFIDLDNFKMLNDTRGHNIGDLLLIEAGNRLQGCIREGDTVARLGGDEFVIILEDLSDKSLQAIAQTEAVCHKILAAISQPYSLKSYEYRSSASIGISLFHNQEITVDEILKRADSAMYQAKNAGKNTLHFYDPAIQAALEARTALENDLRRALAENQFRLYYQMQVDHSGHILGAEALIRWQHPQRGLVSPAEFIPLAEEMGLISLVGQWVMETACAQLKAWEATPLTRNLRLAVNVSARQFHQPDFVEQVLQTLNRHALNPGRLKLELTESLVLDNIDDTIVKMQAIRKLGVRFSMDDFGTGYSSLSYLTQLPLDQLKIDRSFVRNIGVKHTDAVIVQTIIGMAHNLGMEVIAEGVETEDQRAFLEKHGCALCQGYLFGKPVPVDEFMASVMNP